MITFAIPTWNRANELNLCIESICEQVKEENGCYVTVCDNGSTDDTKDVLRKYASAYDFFSFKTLPETREGASWIDSVEMVNTDWTWTFGDDDILLPNALKNVIEVLESNPELHYLHATQTRRTRDSSRIHKADDLLGLCEAYGWIDTCGFISSNICRTDSLKKAYANLFFYIDEVRTVFPSAACLLEFVHDKPAALFDSDLVRLQQNEQTEETLRRWQLIDSSTRYFFTVDTLIEIIKRVPRLNKTFPPVFFRYHTYHLWDRHLSDLTAEFKKTRKAIHPGFWKRISLLADFVSEVEVRKAILNSLNIKKKLIEDLIKNESHLNQSFTICNTEVYGLKNLDVLSVPDRDISEHLI